MDFWFFLKRWFLGEDWENRAKDSDLFEEEMRKRKTSFEDSDYEFSSSLFDSPDYFFLPFNIFHDDHYDTFHDTFNDYFNDTFHDGFFDNFHNTSNWD